ncbi:MAG TPA: LD-carboxypeptidase [Ohtaekwangia sp.]
MIKPPFLKPGDTIGIAAPGRKVSFQNIEAAITAFQYWGLKVKLADNLFSENHSYLAGTDAERMSDFQQLINDPAINAIVCARGGYGSSRFIDQIDFSPLQKNPKWFVGFSDVTAFHLKLFQLGIQSIHGTMPILFSKPESDKSIQGLFEVLFGQKNNIEFPVSPENKPGKATGQVIGGNLSLIIDSLATSSEPDTTQKILVIEEVDEYRYKIDRMLNHLKRSGKLESLSGLIIGHFTDILDTELSFGETPEEIILHHVREYSYPVAFRFPSGHENPNLSWQHGGEATLVVEKERSLLQFIN